MACAVCGSDNLVPIIDEDVDDEQVLQLCAVCHKRQFGEPDISFSVMYT